MGEAILDGMCRILEEGQSRHYGSQLHEKGARGEIDPHRTGDDDYAWRSGADHSSDELGVKWIPVTRSVGWANKFS